MNLIAVHESLQRTNWAGAQTSAAIVGQSIEAITKVYVRRRHYLPEVAQELKAVEQAAAKQDSDCASEASDEPTSDSAGEEL